MIALSYNNGGERTHDAKSIQCSIVLLNFLFWISTCLSSLGHCGVSPVPLVQSQSGQLQLQPGQVGCSHGFKSPYPGYLDALNSTIINLITQLNTYKSYIDQAFKTLQTYDRVFPQPPDILQNKSITEIQANKESSINGKDILTLNHNQSQKQSTNASNYTHPKREFDNQNRSASEQGTTSFHLDPERSKYNSDIPGNATYDIRYGSMFQAKGNGEQILKNSTNPVATLNSDNPEQFSCGKGLPLTLTERENDRDENTKWNVAIGLDTENGFTLNCGGALINEHTVISSAHCFNELKSNKIRLADGAMLSISEIIVHPKYNPIKFYNDIAILKLKTKTTSLNAQNKQNKNDEKDQDNSSSTSTFNFNLSYMPCLPSGKNKHFDLELFRSGSGLNKSRESDDSGSSTLSGVVTQWKYILKNNNLKLIPNNHEGELIANEDCELAYHEYYRKQAFSYLTTFFPSGLDSSLICVKLAKHRACEENRGYQMVTNVANTSFLHGTRTNGLSSDCDFMNLPGIYTSIPYFSNWIEANL